MVFFWKLLAKNFILFSCFTRYIHTNVFNVKDVTNACYYYKKYTYILLNRVGDSLAISI